MVLMLWKFAMVLKCKFAELSSRKFMALKEHRRNLTGRTGCGICGTEQLNQVYKTFPKLDCTFQFDLNLLDSCLIDLQKNQLLGCKTGATHACIFDLYGSMLAIYEDGSPRCIR